jgi:protein-S-isoprenylcysteine O-methyltransferase Ste14
MKKPIQPTTPFMILLILSMLFYFIPIKISLFPYNYLGIILILFGGLLNIWSDQLFKKVKTNIKYHKTPSKLLISGPFKISRNPIYLGMFLILLGVVILIQNPLSLIFPIIFIIIIEKRYIPIEEKNMKKTFGKQYLNYKNKVRRWI